MSAIEANLRTRAQVVSAWRTYSRRSLSAYLRGQAQIGPLSELSLELLWLSDVAKLLED